MPRPRSERRSWPAVVLVGLLLPTLYVLSIGPVSWLADRFTLDSWVWSAAYYFYLPLGWLREACPPFEVALNWYAGLWIPD